MTLSSRERLKKEFDSCMLSLKCFRVELQPPTVFEFQYALSHMSWVDVSQTEGEKASHCRKAAGHIHRAHLDWLKLALLGIQNEIRTSDAFGARCLGCRLGILRRHEFEALRNEEDRLEIFDEYRTLLSEAAKQSQKITDVRTDPERPAEGFGGTPSIFISPETSTRFREWAVLEAQVSAIQGRRFYDHVFEIVQAYLKGRLDSELMYYITVLKFSTLKTLNDAYKEGQISKGRDMFEDIVKDPSAIKKWEKVRDLVSESLPTSQSSLIDELYNDHHETLFTKIFTGQHF